MSKHLVKYLIAWALMLIWISFIIGMQVGIRSAYMRVAKGEVVVVPFHDTYQLEWRK